MNVVTDLLRLLLAAAHLTAAQAAVPALTRGPYLQLLGTNEVTIVWQTAAPAACAVAIRPVDGAATTIAGGSGTTCAIRATGLAPGARYAYTPLADGSPIGPESIFRTDDRSLPYRFLVFGDSGTGLPHQYAVRDAMLATPADFIVHTGDMIYEDGAAADFNPKFFAPYRDLLRQLVLWPCAGNHDIRTAGGAPWREAFWTPANNAARSEHYYSFDYGNAHVVMLDSNQSTAPGSPQYLFLDADLAATTATWKIVAFHHTIYSSGSHGGALAIRTNLLPLFDAHAVDLVFMGHDHDWERTWTLRNDQVVVPGTGTVYITTGGGGGEIRSVSTSPFTAHSESAFHFARVAVDGDAATVHMIREDGAIRDGVVLAKGAPPVPICGDGLVNQPGESCDGSEAPACAAGCTADCTCLPLCGDGRVNQESEVCDGADDAVCPGLCLGSCRCGDPRQFLTLASVADTSIEAATEATWDQGNANHHDVDDSPRGIGYLRFDLPAVDIPLTRALLVLSCTNDSPDGGSVHPVADSSWPEGNRTGTDLASANGPGLKWTDVDTNADGEVGSGDTSPWVPDLGRWARPVGEVSVGQTVTVDVTVLIAGGPGPRTLAIRGAAANGASYASREHSTAARRPRLRLEFASVLPTTTSTSTTSTTRASTSTSTSTTRATTTTSTSTTRPSGPAAVVEADVTVREKNQGANLGASPELELDATPRRQSRVFLRVRVTGVGSRLVTAARLRLQVANVAGAESNVGGRLHRIGSCGWNELTMTWRTQPVIDGPVLATVGTLARGAAADFDVTSVLARDGVYCFALETGSQDNVVYNSREGNPQRPAVVLEVAP